MCVALIWSQMESFLYSVGPLTYCHSHQSDYLHSNNWSNWLYSGLSFGFWFHRSLMCSHQLNEEYDWKLWLGVCHTQRQRHKAWYIFYFPITFLQNCTHNAFFLLPFFFLTRNQCWGKSVSNIKAFWDFTLCIYPLHSTDLPLAHVTRTIPRTYEGGWTGAGGGGGATTAFFLVIIQSHISQHSTSGTQRHMAGPQEGGVSVVAKRWTGS